MPTEELKQGAEQYLMGTYARQPVSIVRGRGTKVAFNLQANARAGQKLHSERR